MDAVGVVVNLDEMIKNDIFLYILLCIFKFDIACWELH